MIDSQLAWARETVRLLHTLDPPAVTVLTLTYFAGMSQAEVCAHTGWTTETVRHSASSGLRALSRLIRDQAGGRFSPVTHTPAVARP